MLNYYLQFLYEVKINMQRKRKCSSQDSAINVIEVIILHNSIITS